MSLVALPRLWRAIAPVTPFALNGCLEPLLSHMRWRGTPRQIAEATGLRELTSLIEFRNTMARLGFSSRIVRGDLADLDTRVLPCLILTPRRALVALAAAEGGTVRCFDAETGLYQQEAMVGPRGVVCTFTTNEQGAAPIDLSRSWLSQLLDRFRSTFAVLLGLTLILNVLALVPAFFVQSVYDRILPARDLSTLWAFLGGMVMVLAGDLALRLVRGAVLAHLGARLEFIVTTTLLEKLLSLPLAVIEGTTEAFKLAQLREGGIVRNVLAGSLALSILEVPFMGVFIAALAYVGGWLALVPVGLVLFLVGMGLLIMRAVRTLPDPRGGQVTDHQGLLIEMLSNITAIKAGGTEALWRERYRERSARSATVNFRELRYAGLTEAVAYVINIGSGAATLATGAMIALDGQLSVGSLIASMTIVWRLLAPVQAIFVTLTRIEQIRLSSERLTRFMRMPGEPRTGSGQDATTRGRRFAGRITFDRVFLRHEAHREPALNSISFNIAPGEIVAVAGGNGSGKSTVLKLIAALVQPQMGSVSIDGVDTRQLRPQDLRQWVALLPQRCSLFQGSIRDNLLLGRPTATDEDLWDVLAQVGLTETVQAMPGDLGALAGDRPPENFVRRLGLARVLLVDAPIVLMDEPNVLLDEWGNDLLIEQLNVLRGRVTVLLATHHPDHVRAADRAVVLRNGAIVHDGTPDELMQRLNGQIR